MIKFPMVVCPLYHVVRVGGGMVVNTMTELDHFTKNMDDGEGVSRPVMGNFHMFIFFNLMRKMEVIVL